MAAYGEWIKGRRAPAAMRPPAPGSGREPSARIAAGGPVALAVLGVGPRAARCRRVDDGSLVAYRPADRVALAPGTVVTVKARVAAGRLEGEVIDTAVDAEALGLEPLGLVELAPGPPRRVRLAPLAPADALEEAARLAEFGDPEGAIALAHAALDEDLRRLDAHAILGDIALGADRVADALAHYAVGAAIGDLSVPAEGAGELPWSEADNHAYLACLYGCARALRRLGRERDAAAPLARLLALDPDDGLGASGLMRALQR
ncbi:MAG: hypothetical protein CSA66_04315 [Proteobacteria bacterium]|nr:MAG: hypothetical protein CSA66_04315 [Pseudomonadota bacterium]